jgi:hypothetical protein
MRFSLGYTRNHRYLDEEKTFSIDTYSLSTNLAIYPDLTSAMSVSYSESDVLVKGAGPGDKDAFVNTKSISSRIDASARLYRSLTAFLEANYNTADNDLVGSNETARSVFSLNYRPSDIMNLRSSYTAFFLDDDRTNSLSASVELYLLRTYKSRLSLYVNHARADESTTNIRVIGSWDISEFLTFSTSGNYNISSKDTYSFNASLSMRL